MTIAYYQTCYTNSTNSAPLTASLTFLTIGQYLQGVICIWVDWLTTTEMPSKCGSLIVWDNASNEDLQCYMLFRLVCQRLDDLTLADSIVYCINPSCQKHQQTRCIL